MSAPADGAGSRALSAVGIVAVCLVAVLAAGLELLLVPLRVGTVMAPVSVLCAVVGNVALVRAGRVFVRSTGALVAPFVAWLVPVVGLAMTSRPEGDVLIPGGGGEQWVFYAMLLAGGAAGLVTVFSAAPPRPGAPRGAGQGAVR